MNHLALGFPLFFFMFCIDCYFSNLCVCSLCTYIYNWVDDTNKVLLVQLEKLECRINKWVGIGFINKVEWGIFPSLGVNN